MRNREMQIELIPSGSVRKPAMTMRSPCTMWLISIKGIKLQAHQPREMRPKTMSTGTLGMRHVDGGRSASLAGIRVSQKKKMGYISTPMRKGAMNEAFFHP